MLLLPLRGVVLLGVVEFGTVVGVVEGFITAVSDGLMPWLDRRTGRTRPLVVPLTVVGPCVDRGGMFSSTVESESVFSESLLSCSLS